ncbi:hypothetical protein H1Z61_01070 [Bacillus aquiflavi]|uniref:Uncharacterized protein n=1 Tax=Bacillus aquiflavi TaxID=2672567 RepID=A0A6B3VX81_9BACI|nr:hypothetical protein [Bacillus aquiflavi]MBA4535760.1 hypothetical protein [Bacillus aquiflavi]NEY80136.1 hypothetical protein [Bacillus aquiflavi]UAC47194.1 hypothetical protein K6959_10665 [Bacillus aquiflavi]
MLYGILIILVLVVIALIMTLFVVKDVSKTIKKYEKNGDSLQNEILRSREYEVKSLKVNIRSLTWIYVVICLIIIGVSFGFVFVA